MQGLRAWQHEAIEKYFSKPHKDFALTATPGAGKTTFALTIAKRLLDTQVVNRVVVAVPTDHLKIQWARAAAEFGIDLDAKLDNASKLRPKLHGYVATYATIAAHPVMHERRSELRTLVILDEIHHAGDGLTWGEAIKQSFEGAKRRLTLTGTPFRTSVDEQIPFVRYEAEDGGVLRSVADYEYSYSDGLRDAVVRPAVFAAYSGVARWMNSAGDVLAADLSEPLTKRAEKVAWQVALDPSGDWVPHVLEAASERLCEIRNGGMPDAGCLILASDQDQARAYAALVKKITGQNPVLVLSDDPAASRKIKSFNEGDQQFIVAVRMVSEGVDIRRLSVLVWLTSYQTPLFFAQAVGRVLRARNKRETATVFLPAVRPLLALAAEMEVARDHVLHTGKEADGLDTVRPEPAEGVGEELVAIGSEAHFGHVLYGGRAITGDQDIDITDEDQAFLGLPGLLSPSQTAAVLAAREKNKRRSSTAVMEDPRVNSRRASATEEIADLRSEIASMVRLFAGRTGESIPKAHMLVRNSVPGPKNAEAGIDILRARRDWLLARTM